MGKHLRRPFTAEDKRMSHERMQNVTYQKSLSKKDFENVRAGILAEQLEFSYASGEQAKWYSHIEQCGSFL